MPIFKDLTLTVETLCEKLAFTHRFVEYIMPEENSNLKKLPTEISLTLVKVTNSWFLPKRLHLFSIVVVFLDD